MKTAFNLDVTSLSTKSCFMQTSGRGWNQPMGAEVIQQLATFLIYYSITPNRTPHHMTEQDALHVSRKMVDLYIWPRNKVQNARRYEILHHWSVVSIGAMMISAALLFTGAQQVAPDVWFGRLLHSTWHNFKGICVSSRDQIKDLCGIKRMCKPVNLNQT